MAKAMVIFEDSKDGGVKIKLCFGEGLSSTDTKTQLTKAQTIAMFVTSQMENKSYSELMKTGI